MTATRTSATFSTWAVRCGVVRGLSSSSLFCSHFLSRSLSSPAVALRLSLRRSCTQSDSRGIAPRSLLTRKGQTREAETTEGERSGAATFPTHIKKRETRNGPRNSATDKNFESKRSSKRRHVQGETRYRMLRTKWKRVRPREMEESRRDRERRNQTSAPTRSKKSTTTPPW